MICGILFANSDPANYRLTPREQPGYRPVEDGILQLCPVVAVEAAVLHRFGDVFGRYGFRFPEVGDSARDFEDAVVRARR